MNNNVSKQELLKCIEITKELFLKVGYNPSEEQRVNTLAESLARTWKKEFTRWDINDLGKKTLNLALDSDIEKFTARTVLRELRNIYSAQFPKSKSSSKPTLNRRQIEHDYIRQVISRIEEENPFPRGNSWRQLSLFHLVIDKCERYISPEKVQAFFSLREYLTRLEGQKAPCIAMAISLNEENEKPKRSQDGTKITELANDILIELGQNKNDMIKLLSQELRLQGANLPTHSV